MKLKRNLKVKIEYFFNSGGLALLIFINLLLINSKNLKITKIFNRIYLKRSLFLFIIIEINNDSMHL
jgi:hypothetical protein